MDEEYCVISDSKGLYQSCQTCILTPAAEFSSKTVVAALEAGVTWIKDTWDH